MPDIFKEISEGLLDTSFQKRFLEKRQIFLWGAVTDASSRDIINKMMFLVAEDPKKDITLFINSPGGVITSGMSIVDTMNMIKPDVATVCMGLAASMGAVLLACGTKGKRSIWPHGKVMIHQPLISGQIVAPAIDIKIHADEIKKTRHLLNQLLAERCGKKLEILEKDTDRDFYMNADEAIKYGIVDTLSKAID